jgi:hypothetical protein
MSHGQLLALVLVGSVDNQPLRGDLKVKFKSNRGLAEARALWVEGRLHSLLPALPPKTVILASGPSIEATTPEAKQQDRHVAVYAIGGLSPKPPAAEHLESQLSCRAE